MAPCRHFCWARAAARLSILALPANLRTMCKEDKPTFRCRQLCCLGSETQEPLQRNVFGTRSTHPVAQAQERMCVHRRVPLRHGWISITKDTKLQGKPLQRISQQSLSMLTVQSDRVPALKPLQQHANRKHNPCDHSTQRTTPGISTCATTTSTYLLLPNLPLVSRK